MGGLLGLGLGMSFISAIEIFYYLLFRRVVLWIRSQWTSQTEDKKEDKKFSANLSQAENGIKKLWPTPEFASPPAPIPPHFSRRLDGRLTFVRHGSLKVAMQQTKLSNLCK